MLRREKAVIAGRSFTYLPREGPCLSNELAIRESTFFFRETDHFAAISGRFH